MRSFGVCLHPLDKLLPSTKYRLHAHKGATLGCLGACERAYYGHKYSPHPFKLACIWLLSVSHRMPAEKPQQLWLVNPRSGGCAGERLLEQLRLCPGVRAEPLDFGRLPEQIETARASSRLVIAGGDGTFSAVLSSPLLGNTPVVCMPLGTANDLARELGLRDLVRRARIEELPGIFSSLPLKPIAIWQARSGSRIMPFCNYLALGFEGAVVRDFSSWRANARWTSRAANRLRYSLYGTRRMFFRLTGLELSVDGAPARACPSGVGLLVSNIRSHLGLGLSNQGGSPFDDTVECIVPSTILTYVRMVAASLRLASAPAPFVAGRALRIGGVLPGTPLQIDGEAQAPLQDRELEVSLLRFAHVAILA